MSGEDSAWYRGALCHKQDMTDSLYRVTAIHTVALLIGLGQKFQIHYLQYKLNTKDFQMIMIRYDFQQSIHVPD